MSIALSPLIVNCSDSFKMFKVIVAWPQKILTCNAIITQFGIDLDIHSALLVFCGFPCLIQGLAVVLSQ